MNLPYGGFGEYAEQSKFTEFSIMPLILNENRKFSKRNLVWECLKERILDRIER